MKAFVMKEVGRVGFMEKPVPQPGPGDAVVQATKALICIGPRENLVLGHEAVGVVHAVGSVSDKKLENVVKVRVSF